MTTTIGELCGQQAGYVRQGKEAEVERYDARTGRPDINPTVVGWRAGAPVVLLIPKDVDRDQGLLAVNMVAGGFGCDAVAMSMDTWSAATETNPLTGRRWASGEMQRAVFEHGALEKGWIVERLQTHVVNRAGDVAVADQPYRMSRHQVGRRVWWTVDEWLPSRFDDTVTTSGFTVEGLVPDSMRAAMGQPTLQHVMAKDGMSPDRFGLSLVEGQALADVAVLQALGTAGWEGTALLLADDPERQRVIDEALGRPPAALRRLRDIFKPH